MSKLYNVRCIDSDEIINDNPISEENIDMILERCKRYDSFYHHECTYVKEEAKV